MTADTWALVIRCPHCNGELASKSESALQCLKCSRTYRSINGVPSLAINPNYYYGEIPQATMQTLLSCIRTSGLERGVRDGIPSTGKSDYFINYALRDRRAGWIFLLPIQKHARILDVGCGPGSLSISLARHGHEVVGVDLALERAQFLSLRAHLLGLENVCAVHGGDGAHLPFASGSFDLVILNGVLEWLAQDPAAGKPSDVQWRFLEEAGRVLAADRIVYVGIENRYGMGYFLGKTEEHARIPWVSLLPRGLANVYARARTGHPYRTWTYSLPSLKSLLKRAGFRASRTLLPLPDYREYDSVVDGESRASIGGYLSGRGRKRAFRMFGGRMLLPYVAPSFGMLGGKGETIGSSWLERLIQNVPELAGSVVERYLVTSTDTVVVRLRTPGSSVIARMPLNPAAHEACLQNELVLRRLGNLSKPWLPRIISSGKFEGSEYFIETALQGQPITAAMIPSAMRFLLTLHSIPVSPCNWEKYMRDFNARLTPYFPTDSLFPELVSYVEESLARNVSRILSHGDYWRGNILGERARINGLVDWSQAVFGVPSMSDALHLLIFERSEKLRISIVKALVPFINGAMQADEKSALDEYATGMKLELDAGRRGAFAALYWLEYLAQRLGRPENLYAMNAAWLRKHVSEPVDELTAALGFRRAVHT